MKFDPDTIKKALSSIPPQLMLQMGQAIQAMPEDVRAEYMQAIVPPPSAEKAQKAMALLQKHAPHLMPMMVAAQQKFVSTQEQKNPASSTSVSSSASASAENQIQKAIEDNEKAVQLYKRALALEATDAKSAKPLYEQALASFKKALTGFRDNEQRRAAEYATGSCLHKLGQREEALTHLQEAVRLNDLMPKEQRSDKYQKRLSECQQASSPSVVATVVDSKATPQESEPSQISATRVKGQKSKVMQGYDAAVKLYKQALEETDAKSAEPLYKQALAGFETALAEFKVNNLRRSTEYMIGNCLDKLGQREKALEHFQEAARLNGLMPEGQQDDKYQNRVDEYQAPLAAPPQPPSLDQQDDGSSVAAKSSAQSDEKEKAPPVDAATNLRHRKSAVSSPEQGPAPQVSAQKNPAEKRCCEGARVWLSSLWAKSDKASGSQEPAVLGSKESRVQTEKSSLPGFSAS